MTQDTGKFRQNKKDQYYTNESTVKYFISKILEHVKEPQTYVFLEPSAGNGIFLKNLPTMYERIGIDMDPKDSNIIKCDYLTYKPNSSKIVVFGNPPFGSQSSLAKAFIKHSCKFASYIAFILPKSFSKPSMYNAFDNYYHKIFEEDCPENCFIVNDEPYNVPCIFVIYEKRQSERKEEKKIVELGFSYVKAQNESHITFRRVGVYAGKTCDSSSGDLSVQSHYFIKLNDSSKKLYVIEKLNKHTFPSNTVGPRSISKQELNLVLNSILAS